MLERDTFFGFIARCKKYGDVAPVRQVRVTKVVHFCITRLHLKLSDEEQAAGEFWGRSEGESRKEG